MSLTTEQQQHFDAAQAILGRVADNPTPYSLLGQADSAEALDRQLSLSQPNTKTRYLTEAELCLFRAHDTLAFLAPTTDTHLSWYRHAETAIDLATKSASYPVGPGLAREAEARARQASWYIPRS